MGLFSKRQDDSVDYQQPVADEPVAAPAPVHPTSIDGVLPAQQDAPTPHVGTPPVPPADDQSEAGGYIMTDPAPAASVWDDGHTHQEDEYQESAPEVPDEVPQEQSEPTQPEQTEEPAPAEVLEETYQHAHEVPSTHPLPEEPAAALEESAPTDAPESDELGSIRSQALKDLSPLVGHLDQSPEERFHTTMMMLQETDDHRLVKTAYEAAQEITDDKTRAQALLDIVNEINYFTQKKS